MSARASSNSPSSSTPGASGHDGSGDDAHAHSRHAVELNRSIFEIMPGGIVHVSAQGAILRANPEAQRLLGYSYDALTRRYTADWSPETIFEDGSPCTVEDYPVTRALTTGKPDGPVTIGVKRPDGRLFWAVFRATPVFESDGETVGGAVVTFLDVSAERESIVRLNQREKDLSSLIRNIPHYVVNYTPDGTIVFVNRVDENLTIEDVLGTKIYDYYPPEEHESIRARLERILSTGETEEFESSIQVREKTYHLHNVIWPFEQDGRRLIGAISTDITDIIDLNHALRHQAYHDSLTGLGNRHRFEEVVDEAIRRVRESDARHVLCYLDLDQFKVINDTCGHMAGDEMLRRLAVDIRDSLPESAVLARLGGDEFGVLLYDTDTDKAHDLCERVLDACARFTFHWEDHSFRVGASIGLVILDRQCEGYDQLLKDADLACFAAKDTGRNQIHVFNPDDERMNRRKREMLHVNEINAALAGENFELFHQKIIPLKSHSDKICFEVLTRMTAPDGTAVAPAIFIGAAERYDLMREIDRWVVNAVLKWMSAHPLVLERTEFLTLNLSGKSVGNERFQTFCRKLFAQFNLPFDKIRIELTETAAIGNLAMTRKFIQDMRALGVRFALDDFGSGISSFGYLRSLPIDLVKIDGSFVRRVHEDRIDLLMVKSIHDLAAAMGMQTVAEFVENEEILTFIRGIGMDYGQGFHLHRPEPLSRI